MQNRNLPMDGAQTPYVKSTNGTLKGRLVMSAILCSYSQFQEAPKESRGVLSLVETSTLARETVRLLGKKFGGNLIDDCNYLIHNFPRIEFRKRLNERFTKIVVLAVLVMASALFGAHLFVEGYNALHYWKWYVFPVAVGIAFVCFWDAVIEKEWVNFFLGKEGGHLLEPFLIEYGRRATQVSLAHDICKKYQEFVGEIQQPEEFKERFENLLKGLALEIVTLQKKKKLLGLLSGAEEQRCRQLGSELRNWAYDASEWLQLINGDITAYFRWAESEWKRRAGKGEIEFLVNYQI